MTVQTSSPGGARLCVKYNGPVEGDELGSRNEPTFKCDTSGVSDIELTFRPLPGGWWYVFVWGQGTFDLSVSWF